MDYNTIKQLRDIGVRSFTMTEKGKLMGVEFFPPDTMVSMRQAQHVAAAEQELDRRFDPPKVRVLQAQMDSMDDPELKRQIQSEIDKLRREALIYGHSM